MKRKLEVKQTLHNLREEATDILAGVGDGSLNKEQRARLDAIELERTKLNLELEQIEEANQGGLALSAAGRLMVGPDSGAGPALRPPGPRKFADLFGPPASMGDWKSAEEFFDVLHSGLHDPRLVPMASIATGGIPSEGGYSVPEPLFAAMLDASLEGEIVRPRADVMPMTSKTRKAWGFDASSSASTLYGAFTGQWVAEGEEITAQTPKMYRIELTAKKLALLAEVSNELVADGEGYAQQLETALTKAIGWFLDDAFLNGDGASQPHGVFKDTALVVVSAETGQAAGTIAYDNLANMFNRLHPACFANACWICNANTRAQLLRLSMAVGTGGNHIPVLTGTAGKFEMLTLPVVFTEKTPALGSEGDILLADFSQYGIGMRREMGLDQSAHVGFTRDTTYYRGLLRADGAGKWLSAYTPKNGASLSWCVTLAAR
jgi:HK97 family phage major capsid protein